MPRDTFPLQNDRLVVFHFLAGGEHASDHLISRVLRPPPNVGVRHGGDDHRIVLHLKCPTESAVAEVNKDGELIGFLSYDLSRMHYIVKVHNYMLQTLGDARRIEMRPVVRDLKYAGTSDVASAPFLDDIEMPINVPWVIAGRLTLRAYRASLTQPQPQSLP
jgi:hypothetical protein